MHIFACTYMHAHACTHTMIAKVTDMTFRRRLTHAYIYWFRNISTFVLFT